MKVSNISISIFIGLLCILYCVPVAYAQHSYNLPEDFPEIQVNVFDDPEPGYVFVAPCGVFGSFTGATPFLVILDNYGTVVYFREMERVAFDFKLQPNGNLSFFDGGIGYRNFLMDDFYEIIDSIHVTGFNGTDFHDFLILDSNHSMSLGWDDRLVDMDTVVPGGQPGATVRGAMLQERDSIGNIIWEWSSWGHFNITDTDTANIDLVNDTFIDYMHTNAVDQDSDSTILISSKSLHEISKIDKITGELIWRLGGSQNEFTYIGEDTIGFSAQHDIRRLENGNYLLFDNGWFHPDTVSSALELQLDEVNKTAKVINRIRSQPDDILGWIMGSAQRLPGGNTLVGWGSGVPNITEFKPDGAKALEFEFESVSYRAFKFPWKTGIFTLNTDTLDFEEISYQSDSSKSILLTNHFDSTIIITGLHSHTDKFICTTELPLAIEPGDSAEMDILFDPAEIGLFNDMLTIYGEKENQDYNGSFAQQLIMRGSAIDDTYLNELELGQISVYPNPTHGIFHISNKNINQDIDFKVTNVQGQQILSGHIPLGSTHSLFNISEELPGVYIIQMIAQPSGKSGVWKIIKH